MENYLGQSQGKEKWIGYLTPACFRSFIVLSNNLGPQPVIKIIPINYINYEQMKRGGNYD